MYPDEEWIADRIDEWHEGAGKDQQLHEYLGISWEEYCSWVDIHDMPAD